MPTQDQVLPINFGTGIDSKTDPKLVVAGKLIRLENAVFTAAKRVNKRSGYSLLTNTILGGGTITAPQLVKSLGSELFCADQNNLYGYSPNVPGWKNGGAYIPLESTASTISAPTIGRDNQTFQSCAVLGNYILYVWSAVRSNDVTKFSTYYDVRDITLGGPGVSIGRGELASSRANSLTCPKAFVLAGTNLAFMYNEGVNFSSVRFVISAAGAVISGGAIVSTNFAGYTDPSFGFESMRYDVVGTSTGAVIAYSQAAAAFGTPVNLVVITINSASAITNSATLNTTQGASTNSSPIALAVGTDGRVWVYWGITVVTDTFGYYAIFTSSLGVVLAKTVTFGAQRPVTQIVIKIESTTSQQIVYSNQNSTAVPVQAQILSSLILSDAGVSSPGGFSLIGLDLFSKTFVVGGITYVALIYRSNTQGVVVLASIPSSLTTPITYIAISLYGQVNNTVSLDGFIPTVVSFSSTKMGILMGYALTQDIVANVTSQLLGSKLLTYDFGAPNTYEAIVANNTAVLNGGLTWLYDGNTSSELGFILYPVIFSTASSAAGGGLSNGLYTYYAVYQWTDAKGNLYQSSPSLAASITLGGASNTVTIVIATPLPTNKTKATVTSNFSPAFPSIFLYRTLANGSIAHLVTTIAYAIDSVTYVDLKSDSSIDSSDNLYTTGGVLENIVPPPNRSMTLYKNRVWIIDSEELNTIWYSKTLQPGVGISFSDFLTAQVDAAGGECVALAGMDDKLVILEQNLPLVMVGDGANDAGQGSTLSPAQVIPADTGCSGSKGVQTFPMGVLFKSPKGIYLLDRSLSVKYWGMEVEAYNSQTIVASTLIADRTQIRFLCSSGLSLVYDYTFNQWSTFTNHIGYAADVWNSLYVYARTDGSIYLENLTSYLDNTTSFSVLARTAWIDLAGVQGFQRVKKFGLLGDFANGSSASHGVRVSAAYDFETTFSATVPYTFGSASASGVFQYREFLVRQKCDSISLLIEEVTNSVSAEYIDLTDMSFEAGMKKGLNKLPTTRSVS